jgi:uncharacterized protein (DUF58 family)
MGAAKRIVVVLLALSILGALATGGVLFFRLVYLWGGLLLGTWLWSSLSLRGLSFSRVPRSERAQVGQIFEERYEIRNASRLPHLWVEVLDQSALPRSRGSHVLTMIEGRRGRSYLARNRLVQRGAFALGPTVIGSGDIFGLFPVKRVFPAQETLIVYPMMVNVASFPNPAGLMPGGEALRRRTHQVTPNAASVRDYAPGDPLSRIHWPTTARRERFMVKEFELDPLADVWLFMDVSAEAQFAQPYSWDGFASHGSAWLANEKMPLPPSTEEYNITITASLARYFLRQDRAVGLVGVGQHLALLPPDRGARQLGKILDALALLRAEGKLPLHTLLETQSKHLMRGSTVVIVTTRGDETLVIAVDSLIQQPGRCAVERRILRRPGNRPAHGGSSADFGRAGLFGAQWRSTRTNINPVFGRPFTPVKQDCLTNQIWGGYTD